MKKIIILILAVVFYASIASAQWGVGFETGTTCNSLHVDKSYAYDRHYKSQWGFTMGVPVRYDFNSWFGLQSDLSLVYKNYDIERGWHYSENKYKFTNTFIDVPVFARFKFGGQKVHGYLLTGAYIGAWLKSNVSGRQLKYFGNEGYGDYEFDENVQFDSRRDNRFEAGLAIGLGAQYEVSNRIGVFAEARYYYGLADMQKDYMKGQFSRYNNTILLQVGVMYKFKK